MKRYEFAAEQKTLLERMQIPFAIYQFIDKRVVTLVLSDGFCSLFGYTDRGQAYYDMDYNMYRDTHPDDTARIADAAFRFATEGGTYDVVYRTKAAGTEDYHIVHAVGQHVYTGDGVRLAQVWYTDEGKGVEDASADLRPAFQSALLDNKPQGIRRYDYLTGMPSMTYFFELAEAGKAAIERDGGEAVMLFIDLSGMKFFNAKHGFSEGDKLLQAFAQLLIQFFGNENCCHTGGDHFIVYTREEGIEDTLRRLFHECSLLHGGDALPVRVGIYPNRSGDVPASIACDRAKFACDALRKTFDSRFKYYNQNLRDDAERRQYILSNLDKAISEKWIQVYYQPIVRSVSESVCDEEALARWIDPVRGFLSPAEFIPFLEDAGQIYKLDLYVLEQILKKMRTRSETGLHIVPHSVNLSRSDFDACDIVEEIRRRVDDAGVDHRMITIEITESIIGSDFDFMKEQISRFQQLGFPVWMDDFGSGYSSLDVLQSVKFDLLKFDMSFMRKLDEGDNGKIILTELMKMADALGVDTVCEGVETEAQVRFLREIGCSKLQGYYYSKPLPLAQIMEKQKQKNLLGYENPDEAAYHEAVGRINLYDFAVIADMKDSAFHHFFSSLPMGIIEVNGDSTRFVRSNQSYRDFIKRFFHFDLSTEGSDFSEYSDSFMYNVVKTCCEQGSRTFYDDRMPDGSVVHSFARRVGVNPVNGNIAVAIVVLSITEPSEATTYADIARALAADYYNIYVVDLVTDDFIEYSSRVGGEELAVERHGKNFFESSIRDTQTRIYEEDRETFLAWFTKERIVHELDTQGVFTATYRLIDTGAPMYVNMKINRMQTDRNRIIMGISIIDSQMKHKEEDERLRMERTTLGRIAALAGNYIVLYSVNPETGHYVEYSAASEYASFGLAKEGEDFFVSVKKNSPRAVDPAYLEDYLRAVTKENVLREIAEHGLFSYDYRLVINGQSTPISMRAALVKENDGEKLIIGLNR